MLVFLAVTLVSISCIGCLQTCFANRFSVLPPPRALTTLLFFGVVQEHLNLNVHLLLKHTCVLLCIYIFIMSFADTEI